MSAGVAARQIVVKSTVAADEHPDLFKVLADMPDPRRRSSRLRDLAMKGLLFEKGVAVGEAPKNEPRGSVNNAEAGAEKRGSLGGHTVDEHLNWGG